MKPVSFMTSIAVARLMHSGHLLKYHDATLVLSGYVESFYQWNFNEPSNFITNFRGFDSRHNIF